MSDFAGVQTGNESPATGYIDPMQWWYDMSQDEQAAYTAKKVAKLQEIAAVVGVSSVATNSNWMSPVNPDGINPALLDEYNRIISQKGYSVRPESVLKDELVFHKTEVAKIETALSTFAGVQNT